MNKNFKAIFAFAAVAVMLSVSMNIAPINANNSEENKISESSDTISSIGSVSKMFAATAAMQLSDNGKLDIDAPVTDYIPEFTMSDERYKDITVRMLMNHSSGLMGTTDSDLMLYDDMDMSVHDTILDKLSTQRLKNTPGEYGCYCNDGFTLLEIVVERVSGESFSDYIQNHICAPLGMKQTGTPCDFFHSDQQADVFVNGNVRFAADYCMAFGAGGILSTAPELCKFGSTFFTGDNTLLSESAKNEMSENKSDDKYEDGFGLGWDIVDYEEYSDAGVKIMSKGGDIYHQHAELLVAPDDKISVSVLSSGGNSTVDSLLAQALMDIALEEKGIKVKHDEPVEMKTISVVPESYIKYEGIYASGSEMYKLSFPDKKYMQLDILTNEKPQISQYMYTAEDNFILMDGDINSGNAVQDEAQTIISFNTRNGIDYICTDENSGIGDLGRTISSDYWLQKINVNPVSEQIQKIWDGRSGKKYYFYNGKYSNAGYSKGQYISFETNREAYGYFGRDRIVDESHAEAFVQIPGSWGRDQSDIEMRTENEKEILIMKDSGTEYISEEAIPEFTNDITELQTTAKKALWFDTGSTANRIITLDIPEKSAVYVYDQYGHVTYSSFMKDYGNVIPLPVNGKIVFLGETGNKIGIEQ